MCYAWSRLCFINEVCQVSGACGCALMNKDGEIESLLSAFGGKKRRVHFKGLKTGGASSEIPRNTCLGNNKAVASCSIHLWYCPRLHMLKIRVHAHIIGSICLCSRFAQTHNIGGVGSLTKPIQLARGAGEFVDNVFYYYYF